MIDRITFFESVSGIQYPEMLVQFFDHFIALKSLVEDKGSVSVESSTEDSITFVTSFVNTSCKNRALEYINTNNIMIYGRPISVLIQDIGSNDLRFILK